MPTTYPIHHGITLASGSEIENAVIETLANDPSPLVTGRVWYNSTSGKLKVALGNPAAACELACGSTVTDAVAALRLDLETQITALDNDTYSKAETDAAVSGAIDDLVGGAPGLLDTLNELAAAIGDDANFVTTIQAQIAAEASLARGNEGSLTFTNVTATDLTDAINAEGDRAKNAEASNTAAVTAEALARATADGNLNSLTTTAKGSLVDAVNEVNNDVTSVQNELNTTQTGAGLSDTGSYTANAGSNYITAATTLAGADDLLDAQAKANADAVAQEVLDRGTAVSGEATTRANADTALQGQIDTNVADISTNATGISTNATAITAAEGRITTLENDGSVSALQGELDVTQVGAGLAASGAYSANAAMNYIGMATSLADADEKLDAQAKANADDTAAEIVRATNAEGQLQSQITAAVSSNTSTQGELDTVEAAAGLNTDGTYTPSLTSNYASGAASLKNADELIDTQVKANTDDIATETAARISADSTLQTNINTVSGAASTNAANLAAEITDARTEEARIEGKVDTNAGSIATNASDIAAEVARAGNAEAGLATDITTEATARSNADAALRTDIDANTASIASQNTAIRGDYNATVFTHQSGAASMVHAIPHNLNSTFVEVSVFMFSGGKWQNDIALIEEVDANNLTITMTDSRDVKVVVRSAASI